MAVKITTLFVVNRISNWVFSIRSISSISSASYAQDYPKSNNKGFTRGEIDPRIQYLKNKLCPENLIKVLDGTSDLNLALKVFKWASLQKQFRHTSSTYSRIILKLGFSGNMDEMEAFCREMIKDKFPDGLEVLSSLVDVFVDNGRLDEAIKVILVVNSSNYQLPIVIWNAILGALVESKREFRDVLLIYKEMVKSGIRPSVDTLNYLIKGLCDADMVENAIDQFRKMKNKGCVPDCRTFEIVICGLVNANLYSEALDVMNEMFENGVNPNFEFYTKVIPLFCEENKLGQAMKLFNMMRVSNYQANFCTYSYLIKCLCINLCLKEAIELFHEMRNAGINPSIDVVVDILNACCKLKKFDEARNVLYDSQIVDPSPYNVLLQGYCDAHCFLEAIDLLQKMLDLDVVDNLSWNILIQGLCAMHYVKQAYQILTKMIALSYVLDSLTYSALILGKCNLRKYEEAMKVFQQISIKDWILEPCSYDKLFRGLCDIEKFREAYEVFVYLSSKNCTLKSSSFNCLIEGFCESGKVDEAIRLLKIGHRCENPVNISTYTTIMCCMLKLKKPFEGLTFFPQILRRGLVLDMESYNIIFKCFIALNETNYCVTLLNGMISENLYPENETFASVLSHFANKSQLHIVWKAISKFFLESKVIIEPKIYNFLINVLCNEGYKTEACKLVDVMLENGWVPDANTHGSVIGYGSSQETSLQILELDSLDMKDEVSCILSEGLGED